jgi:2-C-methyl-D-erythritol 2,4-cyclodiphosphate synthase
LGAAALGDIGTHFPDSDARWAGVSSVDLLAAVVELITARRYRIVNVDAVVITEQPKLAPHIPAMRERLASVLRVDIEHVSVKAKTGEGLDSVGRSEAMAAQAVTLVHRRDAEGAEETQR